MFAEATTITGSFILTNLLFQPAWEQTDHLKTFMKTEVSFRLFSVYLSIHHLIFLFLTHSWLNCYLSQLLNLISKFGLSTTQELSFTITNRYVMEHITHY